MYLLKSWAKEGEGKASLIRGFPLFPLHVLNVLAYFFGLGSFSLCLDQKRKKKIR